ncbi:MAG: hypothetical protein KJ000_31780 [Pirellulaceae bacterium]|nr:hypothetical protein [Pirellulaceae bacterium]
MGSTTARWVWPLLGIVIALFALNVRASRSWRHLTLPTAAQLVAEAAAFIPPISLADLGLDTLPTPLTASADLPSLHRDRIAIRNEDGVFAAHPLRVGRLWEDETDLDAPLTSFSGDNGSASGAWNSPQPMADDPASPGQDDLLTGFVVEPRVAEIAEVVANRYGDATSLSVPIGPSSRSEHTAVIGRPSTRAGMDWDASLQIEAETTQHVAYRRASEASPESIATWPHAPALVARLDQLRQDASASGWCDNVLIALDDLQQFNSLSADGVANALDELQGLARQGQDRAAQIHDSAARNEWGRCVHALERRVAIWRRIHEIAAPKTVPVTMTIRDSLNLSPILEAVERRLENVKNGAEWRKYLCIDEARQLTDPSAELDTVTVRGLARRVLQRMDYTRLTPEQCEFLSDPDLLAYAQELKHLAADPVDYCSLLNDLEDYENEVRAESSARIAAAQQSLRWSHDEAVVRLGHELDGRYRNANIRLAISHELMNRWMPKVEPTEQPVDERIMGVRTRGCSATMARTQVRLLPSSDSWTFFLQADGEVASRTYASQGPATFFTRGRSSFQAEKQIVIRPEGIRQESAEVAASSNTNLAGLRTDIDSLPILGNIAQAIATHQYQIRAPRAESEVRNQLRWRIGEMIDQQVQTQVEQAQQRFTDHFQRPMQKLGVNPMPLEMQTTEHRVIARYRLAGSHQLAAYTPRPLAPGNSLLSLQLHESAMNNVIEQFGWSGRRVPLKDIYQELGTLFGTSEVAPPADLPDDVVVRFADRNPLRIDFQDGRVTITMGLAELAQGRNRWRNFVVRVHYQPALDDPHADLVRDQYVELIGRLALRDQIALRGIFSRVFSREKPFDLISRQLAAEPRLAGLEISQMEILDGWFALAIGPSGTRTAMIARDERYRSESLRVR